MKYFKYFTLGGGTYFFYGPDDRKCLPLPLPHPPHEIETTIFSCFSSCSSRQLLGGSAIDSCTRRTPLYIYQKGVAFTRCFSRSIFIYFFYASRQNLSFLISEGIAFYSIALVSSLTLIGEPFFGSSSKVQN